MGALGYWLLFYLEWEEGGLGIPTEPRTTSRALSRTQSGQAEFEFGTLMNWWERWGPVVFWLKMENHRRT